ncbi:Amino acid transporter [Saccharicrinis carchari]|uniref:Amino acid transporter n=1 Tax=Saccharicrinis carchari TaxID=1168039 RepID=A0A521EPN0_SACCC|nr:amino acid permease [Saccharicrinis carchari]SMO85875.1 Amino acid transporter [Saccharicrinis carchari]
MKLKKELGLFDVFAVSTGAMFSSGFFLLPGLASQYTGPSVILAYLVAGVLILPAMFSIAEISTALPRSGGAYFFLDRSLGPMMGTIGGIGTYAALLLKTAFALVGIGAYASIFFDIPIKETAVVFAVVFTLLNILGAKKTSGIQKVFVIVLLLVLTAFIVDGVYHIFWAEQSAVTFQKRELVPFFTGGAEGFIFTIGFVFVSYLGLTQIASVAEEIKNPDRNIPLGMALSLLVTALIYGLGVFIMVAVIPNDALAIDLAPAATAVQQLFTWLPPRTGLYIIVLAALFAFASTGNAGMLSTSRFPLAMGRDKLFSEKFTSISRFGTPVPAILLTAGLIVLFIVVLSEEGIVKLASTFQLFIFVAINFSVIVFRNSKIASYDPGFNSPLYPWMQIFGILTSLMLISFMGWVPISFTIFIILLAYLWYVFFVRSKVKREGAIFHWFALLGKHQHDDLEGEFLTILREKGMRQDDPFNQTIVRAKIHEVDQQKKFKDIVKLVADASSEEINTDKKLIQQEFFKSNPFDAALMIPEVMLLNAQIPNIDHPVLHIVLSKNGTTQTIEINNKKHKNTIKVFFFLINDAEQTKQQLRMLTGIWDIAERDYFVQDILALENKGKIIEYLLHSKQYITFKLTKDSAAAEFINKKLIDVKLPPDVLVVFIERGIHSFAPHGKTVLHENDILTIIGETSSINNLYDRYVLK